MVLRPCKLRLQVSEDRDEVIEQSVQTDTNVKTLNDGTEQIGTESGPRVPF